MLRVEVTAEHIRQGEPGRPCNCPIALAIHGKVGFIPYVSIDSVHFPDLDDLQVDLPREARIFIANFDTEEPVKPFSFVIDMP